MLFKSDVYLDYVETLVLYKIGKDYICLIAW